MLPEISDGSRDFVHSGGRFFKLPPLGLVEDLGKRLILFWMSFSSVSSVGVFWCRKLSWVAWSTVAGSL